MAQEHIRDCLQYNPDVQPQRPILDVVNIQQAHFFERNFAAPAYLPQSGDSWFYSIACVLPWLILGDFFGRAWSRANQAHFTADHVEHLRQFVDAGAPEELANPS